MSAVRCALNMHTGSCGRWVRELGGRAVRHKLVARQIEFLEAFEPPAAEAAGGERLGQLVQPAVDQVELYQPVEAQLLAEDAEERVDAPAAEQACSTHNAVASVVHR